MKKQNNVSSTIFLIIGLLFLAYAVYMVAYSVNYISTYTTSATISATGSFQYIMTSSLAYFGFGFVLVGISVLIRKLNSISNAAKAPDKAEDIADVTPVAPVTVAPVVKDEEPTGIQRDPLGIPGDGTSEAYKAEVEAGADTEAGTDTEAGAETKTEAVPVDNVDTDGIPVDEDGNPQFQVEYIYEDEAAEIDTVDEAPAPTSAITEPMKELNKIIKELDDIKVESELAGKAVEEAASIIPEPTEAEAAEEPIEVEQTEEPIEKTEKPFSFTTEFIKDIFENK